jgi:hypothetical protein
MAEDSELIGGISVSLGANDSRLQADLAEAERLAQQWAKQHFEVTVGARFTGGTGGAAGGGGQDLTSLTHAIEQGFANLSTRAPARQQPPARPVFGQGAGTAAISQQGQSSLTAKINEELAKQGEVYNELTGEVEKVGQAHRAQRTALEASTRSIQTNTQAEVAAPSVDTGALQGEIKSLVTALAEFRAALATATENAANAPAPAAATSGRGVPRRGSSRARTAAPEEEEDSQYNIQLRPQPRAATGGAYAQMAREEDAIQRRRASAGQVAFREQERQRIREVAATRDQYDELADLADRYFSDQEERIGRQQEPLAAQAALAAHNAQPAAPRPAPTPPRTPDNETLQERQARERNRRDQEFADRANAPRPRRVVAPEAASIRAAQQRQEQLFASRAAGIITPEEREQRIQEDIEKQRANVAAATSTGRTSASRIGSTLLGTGGRRLEADVRAAAARRELNAANRAALPYERELATLNEDIATATPRVAVGLRASRDAFRADPQVVSVFKRQEDAIKGVAAATKEYEKLQGGGNIARNLTAIAAGSFAFSAALKAVDLGVAALGAAAGPTFERFSGYRATTAAFTDSLADATRAASGNAQAVTALKLAGTGIAASTAATIQPLIQQRAEVEAGNKALTDQIEALHVFENLRRSSGNAGLTSNTGGFGPLGGIPGTGEQIGNLLDQQGGALRSARASANSPLTGTNFDPNAAFNPLGSFTPKVQTKTQSQAEVDKAAADFASSLELVNGQLDKGGDAAAKFNQDISGMDPRIEATAKAFDSLSPAMAKAIRDNGLYSKTIETTSDALKALKAINAGATAPDPELLQQQFNRNRQATIAAAERQQQYSLNTQLPAQQALQNLANPLQPVGTGVVAANAKEQGQITAGQQRSVELQKELNSYYEQGKQILIDTYHVPQSLIASVQAIGNEIASTQAGIRNEQAAYAVAQYNFQLRIAKRTLTDISGLTGRNFGGGGQSYLGQLEKENLALSRQAQLLQFAMSQRQINFQTALAGIQAPGVTPEERQARVKEAQIEASFAQKQLDISKQIFGNQVQIVDIQNLRQGADLAAQIGLLLQGRKVTIDTAQAEERLLRLQAVQAKQVAAVGTYLTKVDNLAAAAMSEIQQLELAAGHAMASVAQQVLTAYGVVIRGLTSQLGGYVNTGFGGQPGKREDDKVQHASGAVGFTNGAMRSPDGGVMGEAGSETYAILRNPRAFTGSLGGGVTIGSIFSGPVTVRSDADIDEIARKVTRVMGRDAALKGLRSS